MKNLSQACMRLMATIILALLITHISGCTKGSVPPTFIEHSERANVDWYMVHYELKKEQWNDPDVLSTPRVQFSWAAPDTPEEDKAVWSMRTDGTDLRQVITAELFDTPLPGGADSGTQFQRSPGNRYLAMVVMTKGKGYQRRVIDLETKEVTVIPDYGYGDPHFEWLNDHILLFSSKSPLMQFDIITKELTDLKEAFGDINIRLYKTYDAGRKIIISDVKYNAFMFDFSSKKLLKNMGTIGEKLTKDEKYWLGAPTKKIKREGFGDLRIYTFDDINTEIGAYPKRVGSYRESIFGIDEVYSKSAYGMAVSKMNQLRKTIYNLPGERVVGNFSLYNAESVLGSEDDSKDSD